MTFSQYQTALSALEPQTQIVAMAPQRLPFQPSVFAEFLDSGWMLTLDSDRILLGWGKMTSCLTAAVASSFANTSNGPIGASVTTCAFFAPDFYLETGNSAWRQTPFWDIVDRGIFASMVLAAVDANVNDIGERFHWLGPELEDFSEAFSEIQRGFTFRGLKKAVPVVYETAVAELSSLRVAQILKSLSAQPRQLYIYGFWSQEHREGMIGATPEVLFSQKPGKLVETVALAGTISKMAGDDAALRLMQDPKERIEHQIVVEDIQNQLSLIGEVAVGRTAVLELPTLYHLKTRLQSRPQKAQNFAELTQLLHPTPALGLAPRALGFSEMKRWDHSPLRGRFGAPFGGYYRETPSAELSQHCLVAIRNIQWQKSDVLLGSGCGIVPESRLENEWDELKLKRDSVKRMLGI